MKKNFLRISTPIMLVIPISIVSCSSESKFENIENRLNELLNDPKSLIGEISIKKENIPNDNNESVIYNIFNNRNIPNFLEINESQKWMNWNNEIKNSNLSEKEKEIFTLNVKNIINIEIPSLSGNKDQVISNIKVVARIGGGPKIVNVEQNIDLKKYFTDDKQLTLSKFELENSKHSEDENQFKNAISKHVSNNSIKLTDYKNDKTKLNFKLNEDDFINKDLYQNNIYVAVDNISSNLESNSWNFFVYFSDSEISNDIPNSNRLFYKINNVSLDGWSE